MSGRIVDAIAHAKPSVSFEFFPPKDDAGAAGLDGHVALLEAIVPDFVSVTYGAGGRKGRRPAKSVETTRNLAVSTSAPRVAHLALAGHSVPELRAVIGQFMEAEVAGIMALRGDPEGGPSAEWSVHPGGLTYAAELVELIREYTDMPIGVAAFPYGHPAAASLEADTRALAGKQAVGADFAVTQVLYDAEAYGRLMDRLASAGVDIPVVPGVMPVTPGAKVAKLEAFSGAPLPAALVRNLEAAAGSPEAVRRVGVEWSAQLVGELLSQGAPGVHFYTLNASTSTVEICSVLGLTGTEGGGPATT